jgi:thioredoxin-related protein
MCLAAAALLTAGAARAADDAAPDPDALVQKLTSQSADEAFQAAMMLDVILRGSGAKAEDAAARVNAVREKVVTNKEVLALLSDDLGKKPVLAARLLVAIVRAQMIVTRIKKGSVVVGRVTVEGGKTEPEDVLAQMPILPEGYFAGEVGDLKRPLGFRAPGCENLDVPLDGKTGDLVYVGKSVLKALKKENSATLKGTIALDAAKTPEGATATLMMMVPPPNTPHNGYSPRSHWPQPMTVPVSKTGEFVVTGLSPSNYLLSVTADGHSQYAASITFKPGEEHDAGTITLRCTDVGYYIGKPAPKVGELKWEKDYSAALARAREEKKPILIMETATWCGWCKKLEKETLDDPWVRYALSGYVLVQAFEDKEVEDKYGCEGYPTLVFTDNAGKLAHKFSGYREIAPFLGQVAAADKKLDLSLPEELQTLVEKKIIVVGGE